MINLSDYAVPRWIFGLDRPGSMNRAAAESSERIFRQIISNWRGPTPDESTSNQNRKGNRNHA